MIETPQSPDPRVADLVKGGRIRVALYVPQYHKDPVTGALSGWPIDLVAALGERIGVQGVPVEHPNPADALASIVAGACDAGIIGIEAERATKLDYTAALVEADYTLLVPAGSPYQSLADADRLHVRIAAVRHHASTIALQKIIKHATLAYADTPAATFAIFQGGGADLFASLHEVLRHYGERLPGSRLFAGRYGFNPIGMAVAKGHAARLAYLSAFVEDVKASGLVQRAIDRASWHGIRVAPAANA